MRIAIVDDEERCRESLAEMLRTFAQENHRRLDTAVFSGAEDFLEAFQRERFSLVFMDIFMAGMDGVAAASRLWALDKKCLLVFLTSSEDFRRDALSVHAFEYITKPASPERVDAVLRDALAALPPAEKYIRVASERRTVALFLRDIVSAVTDAHYVNIGLADGSVVRSRMTILEFLRLAEEDPRLVLVNKGIVLNADWVARFEGNCCVMENGARFPVRVRDRSQVEQAVRDYHFTAIRGRQRLGK